MRERVLVWLQQNTASPRRSLAQFTTGGFLFAAGFMIIILSNQLLEASLMQEWFVLAGLAIAVGGGLYALWGYLGISLFKILIFVLERNDTKK